MYEKPILIHPASPTAYRVGAKKPSIQVRIEQAEKLTNDLKSKGFSCRLEEPEYTVGDDEEQIRVIELSHSEDIEKLKQFLRLWKA